MGSSRGLWGRNWKGYIFIAGKTNTPPSVFTLEEPRNRLCVEREKPTSDCLIEAVDSKKEL